MFRYWARYKMRHARPERGHERHLQVRHPRLRGRTQKRPLRHQHGGTTVLDDGARALGRAEELARVFPEGWVYIHIEYRREKEYMAPRSLDSAHRMRPVRPSSKQPNKTSA
jgi:hypothetical protein